MILYAPQKSARTYYLAGLIQTTLMEENPVILYVEDNLDNRVLIRRILQSEGFTLLEAADAASAFAIVQNQKPDLILMDINMPDMDGFTLTQRLKGLSQLDGVPIVALTANVMKGDRERTLQAGCDGYIQKPIDVDTITDQINRFLIVKR